ncbi:MAG: GNAT family N-acetyltransferase [Methylophaga sp.]|nr:GNAT family N-acetyltransferase [Methylophaga sp.]
MEIIENESEYLNDFIALNEEWITTNFQLEDIDKKLAANPQKVIDDGGYIFSLVDNNKVIGVCALFNEGNNVYELARMAVPPEHRGKGYGEKLINACLSKAQEIKAHKVYLVSNTKLEAAIVLYKKHGFKIVSTEQHPVYSRANIIMVHNAS